MRNPSAQVAKWNPANPGQHVTGDPDCECWFYAPEHLQRLENALADLEAGREFRASAADFMRLADGTLDIHELYLRESLILTTDVSPRYVEAGR